MRLIVGVIFLFFFVVILPDNFAEIVDDPSSHTFTFIHHHFIYQCQCPYKCAPIDVAEVLANNEWHAQPYYEKSCGKGNCKCTRSFVSFGTPQGCHPCKVSSSTRRKRSVRGHGRSGGRGLGRHGHEILEDSSDDDTGYLLSPSIMGPKCKCDEACEYGHVRTILDNLLNDETFKAPRTVNCPRRKGQCGCYFEKIRRPEFGCDCQGVVINPSIGI